MRLPSKGWLGVLGALAMLSSLGVAHAQNQGLLGQYYVVDPLPRSKPSRAALFGCSTPAFTRVDPRVDFEWGSAGPTDINGGDPPQVNGADFPVDGFAARWTGTLKPTTTEDTIFTGRSDDGIRVWLKEASKGPITSADAPIVDAWVDRGPADTDSASIHLTAGTVYNIQVEFYENGGGAVAHLNWRPASEPDVANAVAVPETVLTPATPAAAGSDTTKPGAASNLVVSAVTAASAKLAFTAPGDDAATGTAGCYDVRISTAPIDDSNFGLATPVNIGSATPDAGGSTQTIDLTNLPALASLYVGIRAQDEAGNVGPVATSAVFQTLPASNLPASGVTSEDFYGNTEAGVCLDGDTGGKTFSKYVNNAPDFTAFYPHFELYGVQDINVDPPNDKYSNFLTRMRAIFTAPMDGAYTFYISGDDDVELSISDPVTGTAMPDEKTLKAIAGNPDCNWGPDRSWGRFSQDGPNTDDPAAASVSVPITLKKGDRVELQALRQEAGGGENIAVAAIFPDGTDGTGTVKADPNIGYDETNNAPTAAEMKDPAFLHPINGKYLTPWPLPPTGRLGGNIVDAAGNPVAGAKATFTDTSGKTIPATSDASGHYSALLPPGTYTVTASGILSSGLRGTSTGSTSGTAAGDKIASVAGNLTIAPLDFPSLPAPVDKVVYWDTNNTTNWINAASAVKIKDYFEGKGYKVVDAAGLAAFMTAHVTSKTPSVVVTANDIFPDTVVDVSSGAVVATGNLIVDYMAAGGRVVFSGDIPFYNVSQSGANLNPADNGATTILGFNTSPSGRDAGDKPVLTSAAKSMGLTDTWQRSLRPSLPSDVDVVLASAQKGNYAAGWIRFYPQSKGPGGFFRWIDATEDDAAYKVDSDDILANIQRLAEFSGKIGGDIQPPPSKLGDLNGDGKVNVQDATISLRIAVGLVTPTDAQKTAGDVNKDGKLNVQDATQVLRAAVGLVTLG
jgi:hypothetical protein